MPKTPQQCILIKEQRAKSILKTALYLFASKGYNAVTMDEIAKETNCSHGLIYHYFQNKEELFITMMEDYVIPKNREIIADIDFTKKAKDVMHNLLDDYLKALKSDDDEKACVIHILLKLRLEAQYIPKPPVLNRRKRIFDWVHDTIERGKKEGDFNNSDTNDTAIAILSMLTGLSYYRINLDYKKFNCPNVDVIMKMLLK